MEDVIKAADFAAVKHKDQRRKNKSAIPYINHPIGVANILTSEGKVTDPIVLQAALLHDTVEDTDTTIEEILSYYIQNYIKINNWLTFQYFPNLK